MVVRLILKNKQITPSRCYVQTQNRCGDYLKERLFFTLLGSTASRLVVIASHVIVLSDKGKVFANTSTHPVPIVSEFYHHNISGFQNRLSRSSFPAMQSRQPSISKDKERDEMRFLPREQVKVKLVIFIFVVYHRYILRIATDLVAGQVCAIVLFGLTDNSITRLSAYESLLLNWIFL